MVKNSLLIGLSFVLILYSCQINRQNKDANQNDLKESIDSNVTTAIINESELSQIDTLTVQDRRLEGGKFHSHIKLDFATTTFEIKDTNQIRLINEICAVSVIPDTSWIFQQQRIMGDDWNEVLSDNQFYDQLAIDTLKNLDISTYFAAREKRFIKFIKADNSIYMIDLTKMKDGWGLILFNGTDNPVLWSNTEIYNEIKEIYKK